MQDLDADTGRHRGLHQITRTPRHAIVGIDGCVRIGERQRVILVRLDEAGLAVIEHHQRLGAFRHRDRTDCHTGRYECVMAFAPGLLADLHIAVQHKDFHV